MAGVIGQVDGPTPETFVDGFPESVPIGYTGVATEVLRLCIQPAGFMSDLDQSERDYYFDLDQLTGVTQRVGLDKRRDTLTTITVSIAEAVEAVSEVHPLDAIAFYVRSGHRGGPTGITPMASLLRRYIDLPGHFINLNRRLISEQVSPEPNYPSNPNIAVLTDVTASGKEMLDSVEALWRQGIRKVCAISLFDTEEGARENLARYDIPLTTIISASEITPQIRREKHLREA